MEEVGEVCKEILETTYSTYEEQEAARSRYRQEMVQVAAVAVAAIECSDREHKMLAEGDL
jgi:hypothetical protein